MRRSGMLVAALIGSLGLAGCSGGGGSCHLAKDAATERGAVDAFYDGCASRPALINGPYDAGKESAQWAAFSEVVGFQVTYHGPERIRFLLVGRETPASPWRVLEGEPARERQRGTGRAVSDPGHT